MSEQVLVTGGAGFVGSHLCRRLSGEGRRVRVLDNLSTGSRDALPADVELIVGDIRDIEALRVAAKGCGSIFHLAAMVEIQKSYLYPAECMEINTTGTIHVATEAIKIGARVIFASSCAVYPLDFHRPFREEDATMGETPYALSKRAAEQMLQILISSKDLNAMSLRFFNIYGPGQRPDSPYAAVIPKFIDAAMSGKDLIVYGDGKQGRDFIHVQDVVEAYLLAEKSAKKGLVNIGSGIITPIDMLANKVLSLAGRDVALEYVSARSGDAKFSQADTAKMQSVLGFSPKVTLDEGLQKMMKK